TTSFLFRPKLKSRSHRMSPVRTGVRFNNASTPVLRISPALMTLAPKPDDSTTVVLKIWFVLLSSYQVKSRPTRLLRNRTSKPASTPTLDDGLRDASGIEFCPT